MATALAPTAAEQVTDFRSGNEMAAISAKHIDFHVMGYYPITPSTEIAENLDEMRAEGEHSIVMIPADGEHGAAGICYGAATGGGRVFNATSSQGLLYSLEQLPVQSGTRFPMLLDIATRAVSAPLDIRGDHSDIYFALNTGWLIFLARDPQAVYDLNIVALRVARAPRGAAAGDRRLRRLLHEPPEAARPVLRRPGGRARLPRAACPERVTALDPRHPVTIGPYMNDPDLINNKYQLTLAMEAAAAGRSRPSSPRYEELSGRALRRARPLPDGRRRRRAVPAELGRRDGEGRRRPAARRGDPGRA